VNSTLDLVGLELRRIPPRENSRDHVRFVHDLPHALIKSDATYSPWFTDTEFKKVYTAVSSPPTATLVNDLRCYELWKLASRPIAGDVVEIGVWRGGTGCVMAKARQIAAPESSTFLCDTFTGVVGSTSRDPLYSDGEHADTSEEIVEGLLARLSITNAHILRGTFPRDTGPMIADRTFCLVHIDVDVYQSAKDCFEWCWPRVAVGGAVVFDDYGSERCVGVVRFVNEINFTAIKAVLIHNVNGHAVLIKYQKT
jgi:O-methyltransferase